MKYSSVYPYYYPTTVTVVDDNRDFLVNFGLMFNEDVAYKLYHSPIKALQALNNEDVSNPVSNQCLAPFYGVYDTSIQDNIISVDVSKIQSVATDKNRFTENAILIVDYDMPDMDGLQLCQMINNKNIKKIMISGVADEKIAVDAFNRGIIDKFILKNDKQAISKINDCIYDFQNKYMHEKTTVLKNTLNIKAYGFLNDPGFIQYFFYLLERMNVVEYYLVSNPAGFLLFTQSGDMHRLLVMDDDDMISQIEVISDQDGPFELRDMIEKRDVLPCFFKTDGFYNSEISDWKSCIYPSHRINSEHNYYVAVVENVSGDEISEYYSYDNYIEYLDQNMINELAQ
ncbi:MAG: response regulator [Gammaproteobacteria bacterium]|nr:response regulator [Gammaproteobacteria bacterium]